MHQKDVRDDRNFKIIYDFFLLQHIAPADQYMLQVFADIFERISDLVALGVPLCVEE